MLPSLTNLQWILAFIAAFSVGFAKSGFSGAALINVLVMAEIFGARESTGVVLPMLICGDILSVWAFHQHANWPVVWRMMPLTLLGVVGGYIIMRTLPTGSFGPIIGWIVLIMVGLQALRRWRPATFEHVPGSPLFAGGMGLATGVATMLANGAGPIMTLYFLATKTPKFVLVGTSAWFFLMVNLFKVPFSAHLGLIHGSSLAFNALLVPAIALGVFAGRRLIGVISQSLFEFLLLLFAAIASLRLIGLF